MKCTYLEILKEELVLAEGCTEPIAIAYACAFARKYLKGDPKKIHLNLSKNMIKNVDGIVVPNSNGNKGSITSALLGTFFGKSENNLLVISDVTKEQIKILEEDLFKRDLVNINVYQGSAKLFIEVMLTDGENEVIVEIKHLHTNITKITLNDEVVLDRPCNDGDFNSPLTSRKSLNIKDIIKFAKEVEIKSDLKLLLDNLITYNSRISDIGLDDNYGLNVGSVIRKRIKDGYFGSGLRNLASSYAAAGSDARMNGCSLPVMTVSGSGNQGLTSSMGVYEFHKVLKLEKDILYRALIISLLSTIHIKTNIGRLSAFCGVICAGAGSAGAFTYLLNGNDDQISLSIMLTLGDLGGVLCDGAKGTCALKIASSITSAVDASFIAMEEQAIFDSQVGFLGEDVECTIKNIAKLANDGMQISDSVILDIMTNRKNN